MNHEITDKIQSCPRFVRCSANVCPLDSEAKERAYPPGEDACPFTIKKRDKMRKGLITLAPDYLLEVVLESNLEMLSRANQRRWRALHKQERTVNK